MITCSRRRFLTAMLLAPAAASASAGRLRIGTTAVFLDDQPLILEAWNRYLERRLEETVEFVYRGSYRPITDLLLRGEIDAAWTCGLPYVENAGSLDVVAVPLYRNEPLYRSYLIASAGDRSIRNWEDLEGKVFAYSDPDSNSGHLYPVYAMMKAGLNPRSLFRRTFFARGHRNVVEAVAVGLADAGAVDGYVWDTLARDRPGIAAGTRVVHRSEKFGFPPIVARSDLEPERIARLRQVLTSMAGTADGAEVLGLLNLDGFTAPVPGLFDGIVEMARFTGRMVR